MKLLHFVRQSLQEPRDSPLLQQSGVWLFLLNGTLAIPKNLRNLKIQEKIWGVLDALRNTLLFGTQEVYPKRVPKSLVFASFEKSMPG